MSVKSSVSSDYLKGQMDMHGAKLQPAYPTTVLITGTERQGSIGQTISEHLRGDMRAIVIPYERDIRHNVILPTDDFDSLVMCHGVSHLDWFEDAPLEKMKEIVDVNLTGTIALTQAFVKATVDRPFRKRIISIGSMAYKAVLNGSAAYCASKAGLAQLMKCLAWELGPKGFDIYNVHPSNTLDTPMSEQTIMGLMRYRRLNRDAAEAYWNDSQIRKQSLTKREIAELVGYILSGKAAYLSGCNLELAGGQR